MVDSKRKNLFFFMIVGVVMGLMGLVDTIRDFEVAGIVLLLLGVVLAASALYQLIFSTKK